MCNIIEKNDKCSKEILLTRNIIMIYQMLAYYYDTMCHRVIVL